jgi:hypothetical protein
MSELIKQLWAIAWDLWEHCNSILHDQMNTVTDTRQKMVDRAITNIFYTASALLSHTMDDFLVAVPLQTLLKRSIDYKETWVSQTKLAIARVRQERGRFSRALRAMQRRMKQFLGHQA